MEYLEIRFGSVGDDQARDWLVGSLAEAGFESFAEEDDEIRAYIPKVDFTDTLLNSLGLEEKWPGITYSVGQLADINWNSEWEKNYPPVLIGNQCYIRAPFHPGRNDIPLQVIIEPGMAFGTAHHETTVLMIEYLLSLDLRHKDVLDMGCGSGILAIIANKCGARHVKAIDNDEWAYQNAKENFRINKVSGGEVVKGDATCLAKGFFDVILANINRNILIQDMPSYARVLRREGILAVSGFYGKDLGAVERSAMESGLLLSASRINNNWAAALFARNK